MRLRLLVGAKMASVRAAPKLGLRRFGVPPGGPWDRKSAWIANALLGNPLDAPVLEWALSPLEFEVVEGGGFSVVGVRRASPLLRPGDSASGSSGGGGEGLGERFRRERAITESPDAGGTPAVQRDAGRLPAVQGSPLLRPQDLASGSSGGGGEGLGERSGRESPSTESPDAGGTPAVQRDAGRLPAVRWQPVGARGYLALPGGVQVGDEGELRAGLATNEGKVRVGEATESLRDRPIRVSPGPQADQFDLTEFTRTPFRVEPQSNRIGIRLAGPALDPGPEITSEPACHGAIQIDNSGQPIILGPDGPTIGGYPKIAVVCDADLDRLAQLRPGDEVRFEIVTMDQAHDLRREWRMKFRRRLAQIEAGREANARRQS